ncbi:MAG: hypothetical protein K6A44_05775 [bacterium]|nr:hypothetical protein [bacterium]
MSKIFFMIFKMSMEILGVTKNTFGHRVIQFTNLAGLRCAMCGIPMYRMGEIDNFVSRFGRQDTSMPARQSISRYIDAVYFQKPNNTDLLSTMEIYAGKYPDKSFGEIFAKPEVMTHHLQKSREYYEKGYIANKQIFEFMEENLKLTPEQKEKLAEFHKKAVNISIGNFPDKVKKYLIAKNYADFQSEAGIDATATIQECTKKFQTFPACPDFAILQMAGKSDAHIMQELLNSVTPTKKLINPKDEHGIFVCRPCATASEYAPFSSLFYLFPNMYSNIQRQLDKIITCLANGHLNGQGDYPQIIQRLVAEATHGKRILNLNRYNPFKRGTAPQVQASPTLQKVGHKKHNKAKRIEEILLNEPPARVRWFLVDAEQLKRKLIAQGVSPEQIKAQDAYIERLKKIYVLSLRRSDTF